MKIDFYLYNMHEVFVFEYIWQALHDRGVDVQLVIEPPGIHTAMGSQPVQALGYFDHKENELVPLVDDQVFNEIKEYLRSKNYPFVTRGEYDADAVITTQGSGWLYRYKGLKLRIRYGVSPHRDAWGYTAVNNGMDAICIHGEFQRQYLRQWYNDEDILLTGYPKYTPLFRGEFKKAELIQKFNLDPHRKTIVYFSTWAQNTSLEKYYKNIARLGSTCNILYKPHHNNIRFEKERIDYLRNSPGVIVETNERSIVPFIAVGDLFLADVRSGSLTESFIAHKSVIGLSLFQDPEKDNLFQEIQDVITICRNEADVERMVESAFKDDMHAKAREGLVPHLFADFGGYDAEKTAEEIISFVLRKKTKCNSNVFKPDQEIRSSGELLTISEDLITRRNLSEARLILQHGLKVYENNVDMLNNLAVIEIQSQNFDSATTILDSILAIDSDNKVAIENKNYLDTIVRTSRHGNGVSHSRSNGKSVFELIDTMLATNMAVDREGVIRDLDGITNIDKHSGSALYKIVKEIKPELSLEIGCAYGISMLYILQGLHENGYGSHITLDPVESTKWYGIGLKSAEIAGLAHLLDHYELPSQKALPKLLERGIKIQFAFIDGNHLFDQTILEWYYIDKMLDIGGIVVFDDWWMPGVRSATNFVETNHDYQVVQYPSKRIRVLQKRENDKRRWDYFVPFNVPVK
jgi:predicted O-methyltransferase YrrM